MEANSSQPRINRIAIIDHTGVKAGMEKYTFLMGKGLNKAGCEISIFSNFFIKYNGIKCFNIFEVKKSNIFTRFIRRILSYFTAARKCSGSCDLIFIHLFELSIISFIQHLIVYVYNPKKIITIYHDISAFGKRDMNSLSKWILESLSLKIVVHNQFSKRFLLHKYGFIDAEKVIIMKHGHFLDFPSTEYKQGNFESQIIDIKRLKDSGKMVLLFFGQIKAEKGLDILLNSMAYLPENVVLVIAGNPIGNFESYQNLINELKLESRIYSFLRFIEDFEMNYLLDTANAVVLPYRVIFQSGVLLNVLSHKALVVVSDLEPNTDIIMDGSNGFVFQTNSSKSLASKIRLILNKSEAELEEIKNAGFLTIRSHYSWDVITSKLLSNDLRRVYG